MTLAANSDGWIIDSLDFYCNMLKNRMTINSHHVSLPLKISFPFILIFLGVWIPSTFTLGWYFAHQAEQQEQERVAEIAALVEREFEQQMASLRLNARLLVLKGEIVQATSERDQRQLQQELLPLENALGTDLITVVDAKTERLLEIRETQLKDAKLKDENLLDLVVSGVDVSTVIDTGKVKIPLLAGMAPIKNQEGIQGGLILGVLLNQERLEQINEQIRENIIVVTNDRVLTSTFPSDTFNTTERFQIEPEQRLVQIGSQNFFHQSFLLESLDNQTFEVILLTSLQRLEQTQRTIWLILSLLAFGGSGLIATLGYWIAAKLSRPIQEMTKVAYRVIEKKQFDLQVSVQGKDEIGRLAQSLNQLIQWAKQYTEELEIANQTLERRVESRTQELSSTLQELREAQSQLIQTEKMSSLGQMIAGIAHEINNPLTFIKSNLVPLNQYFQDLVELIEVYQTEYPQGNPVIQDKIADIDLDFLREDHEKVLRSMQMGTQRVQDIVIALRNYSRLDEAVIKEADIHLGLDSTLLILNHRIKAGVEVIKDYGDLPIVTCSPAKLNQVFTNIIANALDAMFDANSEPKQLKIRTSFLCQSRHVRISIQDSGPGIPLEVQSKMFDPFFTTKDVGKGTGLGLGICLKIIEQHRGSIEINSAPSQGTEFVITLPQQA